MISSERYEGECISGGRGESQAPLFQIVRMNVDITVSDSSDVIFETRGVVLEKAEGYTGTSGVLGLELKSRNK